MIYILEYFQKILNKFNINITFFGWHIIIIIILFSKVVNSEKDVLKIFADTHKIIASNIHENIYEIYDLKLDKDKLLWGSIAPDVLPQYRLVRHYKDESISFITKEIMKIIFASKIYSSNKHLDPIAIKIFSKKIGIISHYLSDYVCLPHANRWTFNGSMRKHIKYESSLNDYVRNHDFKKNVISVDDLDIRDFQILELRSKIREYIEDVLEEYSQATSFKNDLDFSLSLNLKMTYFILDTIEAYSEDIHRELALLV